ncbi:MAG: hypothetical protein DRO95_03480 [Candidatus Altiarchaeales archaeon]|nr:MAG: hypothetical protein DRO95_03480 [Candidatus Altiarchaeales archaeon]
MVESIEGIEDILGNGFQLWRRNPNLALPFFLNFVVSSILCCIFLFLALGLSGLLDTTTIANIRMIVDTLFKMQGNFILIPILVSSLILILMITESFFIAGAVGMSKEAIETGRTSFGDMMKYGGEKIFHVFIARFILSLLTFVLVLLICGCPVLITFPIFPIVGESIIRFGFSILGILLLIITILFMVMPFAIVIDDLSPLNALRASYKFSIKNKLPVAILFVFIKYLGEFSSYFVMFIVAMVLSIGIFVLSHIKIPLGVWGIVSGIIPTSSIVERLFAIFIVIFMVAIPIFLIISEFLNIFVFKPLSTLWWAMLYISKKSNEGFEKNGEIY